MDYQNRKRAIAVRPKDANLAKQLDTGLCVFSEMKRGLPGIRSRANRATLVEQLVESIHRVKYVSLVRTRQISLLRTNPSSDLFDPLKAAILNQRHEQIDEAFWLVFLSVHFGKHRHFGWRLSRDVYGSLGSTDKWSWARTSANPKAFRQWLAANQGRLPHHFGNHRKYESLNAHSPNGTGEVVESYVRWVDPPRTHAALVGDAQAQVGQDARNVFEYLYRSMDRVARFGRTAKFDYLAMIGKIGLAPVEPGSTYLQGATGPLAGARLLFGGNSAAPLPHQDLDGSLVQLGADLNVGMQVLEDALCNWQKSPGDFKAFRG